jgi:hypothetical protein
MIWYQYNPIWVSEHPGASCTSTDRVVKVGYLSGSLSVFSDFYSVLIPATLLLRIRLSRRERWGLMFIFGVGFL